MEESSLPNTPTWSVATVLTILVAIGVIIHHSINRLREWLHRTRRKALLGSLEKIMEEMMVFGLLSLLLGHFSDWVSRICVKPTSISTSFYPCIEEARTAGLQGSVNGLTRHGFVCPEGLKPFVSLISLEQLDRLFLVLVLVHVFYCFLTVAVAMIKIYSWRAWEAEAKSIFFQYLPNEGKSSCAMKNRKSVKIKRQSTFSFQQKSRPWIQQKVIVWMICCIRQFWTSIDKADYMALRFGFIFNQELQLSYNFHNYMLRSMEDDFRDIVGISVPLWGYGVICIILNVHGSNAYFWLSFIPAVLIIIVGTKLNHIVIQLALELSNENQCKGNHLKQHDEIFWFGKPQVLLWFIQVISFQNAFEMANLIWSLWEIKTSSCFMKNWIFVLLRLIFGISFQFWCSYCTFPLYVIVTKMGSKVKKALLPEGIRESLHKWRKRAERRCYQRNSKQKVFNTSLSRASSCASLDFIEDNQDAMDNALLKNPRMNMSSLCNLAIERNRIFGLQQGDELSQVAIWNVLYDTNQADRNDDDDDDIHTTCPPYIKHV